MNQSDLIISFGPGCKNSWNIRNYFNFDRAYPFDWWITPARSILTMIEPGFKFSANAENLHITRSSSENSVYNYTYNLLHHHDFPREKEGSISNVRKIHESDIEKLNNKYRFLFERLFNDIKQSKNPIIVVNGTHRGWKNEFEGVRVNPALNGYISGVDFAREVRSRLGEKVKILNISAGDEFYDEGEWGWIVKTPDTGVRQFDKGSRFSYAEPVEVFKKSFNKIEINFHPLK